MDLSPIESKMFDALLQYVERVYLESRGNHVRWTIRPQYAIDQYRVDFMLIDHMNGVNIVVECDGHDFHEKTKEQAAKDKKRDRYLQSQGYLVMRYSGSEIWKDADACAQDVSSNAIDWYLSTQEKKRVKA